LGANFATSSSHLHSPMAHGGAALPLHAHGIRRESIAINKATKSHYTGSELAHYSAQLFGVSSKAIRDVRSWSLTTEPCWSETDCARHASRQRHICVGSASAGAQSPSNDAPAPRCASSSETPTLTYVKKLIREDTITHSTAASVASESQVGGKPAIHRGLNGPDDWFASPLPTLVQVQQSCPSSASLIASPQRLAKRSLEDAEEGDLPAKALRAASACESAVRTSWSDLVLLSTTESFQQATEMLVNTSCSQLRLFDQSSGTQVLKCPLDRVALRMCSGQGKNTVVAITPKAYGNTTASQVAAATVYLKLFDVRACQELIRCSMQASNSQPPPGTVRPPVFSPYTC